MKKVLSLLLAVVLVCSMATVALALDHVWQCEFCDGTTNSYSALLEHQKANECGKCGLCGKGFDTKAELDAHAYDCHQANIVCDYCGGTSSSQAIYDAHIDACKAKYHNIPLAKIIATVKDLISKIDFSKVFGTVKDLAGKAVPVVKDLIGKIDFSAIKLPA